MKCDAKCIIFGCVLMLVVILMLTSASVVTPYARTMSTLDEHAYEGFVTVDSIKNHVKAAKDALKDFSVDVSNNAEFSKLRTVFTETADKIVAMISNEEVNEKDGATQKKKDEKESFTNLNGTDYASVDPQTIDVFSIAVGSPTCVNKSSGLSNSMGSLCLTDDMKAMLQTRGGNSTGGDSQIGGK
jgi:hypothetical protein